MGLVTIVCPNGLSIPLAEIEFVIARANHPFVPVGTDDFGLGIKVGVDGNLPSLLEIAVYGLDHSGVHTDYLQSLLRDLDYLVEMGNCHRVMILPDKDVSCVDGVCHNQSFGSNAVKDYPQPSDCKVTKLILNKTIGRTKYFMGNRLSDYENTATMPCKPHFGDQKFSEFLTDDGTFYCSRGDRKEDSPHFHTSFGLVPMRGTSIGRPYYSL